MAEGLCVFFGAKMLKIAAAAFTLSWTHSVEKTVWQEDWIVEKGQLRIVEARIKGSGAGMEPPAGAILRDGWWHYTPKLAGQKRLNLASSRATVSAWTLCAKGECRQLGGTAGSAIQLFACPTSEKP
jgi:hypothetical protein